LAGSPFTFAQTQKQMDARVASGELKIDGKLDEDAWKNADIAGDFIQYDPNPGEPSLQKSEIRILYDDDALYIGAFLYDSAPDSILKQLSHRDKIGNTDWFSVLLDPYKDGQNGFRFTVTAGNVQRDVKIASGMSDVNWNAVWKSAVKINDQGWVVELSIPYSAFRFPKQSEQAWHINFARYIRRFREESWWNEIDPTIDGRLTQSGLATGFKDIKPPLRLSFMPYVSGYLNVDSRPNQRNTVTTAYNAGLDLKYGINEAFTLDMTLVPDFGQTQSDDYVLNLTPFEIQFDEKRQFFTEGLELFSRGNVFYSRRIGLNPVDFGKPYESLEEGETVIENPLATNLLNATKVSGRNRNNLGIGVFNAVEGNSYAIIEDKSGNQRKVLTNPVTNYNMVVFDQGLKNNSYVSVFNTNVTRNGAYYDANVTGTEFSLRDKTNTYKARGSFVASQIYNPNQPVNLGYKYNLGLGKISGNFQYEYWYFVNTDTYDPNDMGIIFSNNKRNMGLNLKYNIYKSFGIVNKMFNNLSLKYTRLYNPSVNTGFTADFSHVTVYRSFFANGFGIRLEPFGFKDYFEPRTPGFNRYYFLPANYSFNVWISSDYRKKFAYDFRVSYKTFDESGRNSYGLRISPRLRIGDKLSFIYEFTANYALNDVGYASRIGDTVLFGQRDLKTIVNTLNSDFIFNGKMGINLRIRQYWSTAQYEKFYDLNENSELIPLEYTGEGPNGTHIHDINYNAFTIDMYFRWEFTPGSELRLVWKNTIIQSGNLVQNDFFNNLGELMNSPQNNSFSIKVIYYLDALLFNRNRLKF
jgi:Domain of unknown function (DUF5916)/Carbohydrate family 9 binding domain-like